MKRLYYVFAIFALVVLNVACSDDDNPMDENVKGKFVKEELVNSTGELKDVDCTWNDVYYPVMEKKWGFRVYIDDKECIFYPKNVDKQYKKKDFRYGSFIISGTYKYVYSYQYAWEWCGTTSSANPNYGIVDCYEIELDEMDGPLVICY